MSAALVRVSPAIGIVAGERDDRPFGQIVAMSAVAVERNGAVVVVGRRDWRDLPAQADFGQAMFGMAGSG